MSRVDGTTFRLTRCRTCGTESKGMPEPTLSPGLVLAYCVGCKARRASDDIGDVVVEGTPGRTFVVDVGGMADGETRTATPGAYCEIPGCPDPAEPGGVGLCTPHRIDDESGMGAVAEDVEDRVQRAYREWRKTSDGAAVVAAIRRRAIELRRRGWSRYGIQALAEVVRFDRALSVGPDAEGYRVNNSHLSRLARDLMAEDPDLASFFEVRALSSERDG